MNCNLSVIIPARNEMFLQNTIDTVLAAIQGDTNIIVVLDGYWPVVPIPDNDKVVIIHNTVAVGQRAAVNIGVALSRSKYVMKLDAHCMVSDGFDVELIKDVDNDTTVVPRLYNLHAFNWVCDTCGNISYQGPTLKKCIKDECGGTSIHREMVWKPRLNRRSDFMRFDSDLHFQYWKDYEKRPESKGDICEVMGNLGACFLMSKKRYNFIGGLDEKHGSWGQMGTEISCKSWLSGGRQVVNKKAWYSHMFRTQGGDFSFPFPLSDAQVKAARERSRRLWLDNTWSKSIHKLSWLVEKFAPVPGWENA